MTDLKEWAEHTQTTVEALAVAVNQLREDIRKTNKAGLLENQMTTRINDLVGLQADQIRTLGQQLAQLDRTLSAHLEDAGYSE